MSDDRIRRAIHELVASAPDPHPLPDREPAPLPGPRSYRWVTIAASAVLIVAGAVAIAAWPSGDSDAPISSDSTVTVSTTGAEPSTAPEPSTTLTAPPTSTTPSESATESATESAESVPTTTEPDGPVDRFPLNVPEGSLAVTHDDLLLAHTDGDLYLHPGILGESPGTPILLVDMDDPRAEPEEGPAPNVVDAAGGIVNGALVYATCCEPVSGNIFSLPTPGAQPLPLAPGYWPTRSPDGTRMATINLYSFEVWDLLTGQRASRAIDADPRLSNAQQLVWSRDGASVFTLRFDDQGWELVGVSADPPFDVTATVTVPDIDSPISSADTASLMGVDPDGNIVLDVRSSTTNRIQSFDPVTLEPVAGAWDGEHATVFSRTLSPDGAVMLLWSEEGLLVQPLGGPRTQVVFEGVRSAWFV